MATKKLAISLPAELFDEIERARITRDLTRSAVIQSSLRAWLRREAESERLRRDIEAYRRHPETDQEVAVSDAISRANWSRVPKKTKKPRR